MCVACWMDWRKRDSRCVWKSGDRISAELKGLSNWGACRHIENQHSNHWTFRKHFVLFMCAWGVVTCFHCQNSDMKISRSFPADKTHNTKIDFSFYYVHWKDMKNLFVTERNPMKVGRNYIPVAERCISISYLEKEIKLENITCA